jgi:hypothetical protein
MAYIGVLISSNQLRARIWNTQLSVEHIRSKYHNLTQTYPHLLSRFSFVMSTSKFEVSTYYLRLFSLSYHDLT